LFAGGAGCDLSRAAGLCFGALLMVENSMSGDLAPPKQGRDPRIESVDLLRGVAIVLMSLDHVREFLQAEQVDPLDLSKTSVILFFTRWVTHFCAPVFVFLAGAGAALSLAAGRSRGETARFLLIRGLWLVVLELTLVRFGWFFSFAYEGKFCVAQVIWAIGWSMVLLAPAVYLPVSVVATIGVAIVAFHNLFDGVPSSQFGAWGWVWNLLHAGGPLPVPRLNIHVAYPLLPWMGVMYAGYAGGWLYQLTPKARRRNLVGLGCILTLLFVGLRMANSYGDPHPWSPQPTAMFSFLSFLNCQKYPPSLLFVLMTLGPAFVLLGLCERPLGTIGKFFVTFGRVPLFFYLVHLVVIHALTMGITYAQHGELQPWLWSFPPGHAGPGCGVSLPVLYLIWGGVVAFHYPLCLWFGRLKRRYPQSLIRYL
jgi:uncharacterized membrane protein